MRWFAFILLLLAGLPACAKDLTVAVNEFPPLVNIDAKGHVSGFDIDIVREVCREMHVGCHFVPVAEFSDIFSGMEKKRYDLAVSGVTINDQREKRVDFSHPYLDSGLRIMICSTLTDKYPLRRVVKVAWGIFKAGIWLGSLILLFGHIVWLYDRGNTFSKNYFTGIADSFYWVITTMSTVGYGDFAPRTRISKICANLLMFIGISMFCAVTAKLSSDYTVESLKTGIEKPQDLKGLTVGVPKDTTSVNTVQGYGAKVKETKNLEEAITLLKQKQVDAVVFDSPAILHAVVEDDKLRTAGEMFDKQKYGIVMQQNSNLREAVNQALLKTMESDRYAYLQNKWFGATN